MKIKKNFLKKLTAGILGFVMTLGVGAAGYAGAASETQAADKTLTFSLTSNPGGWPTTASTTLTNYTYTLDGTSYTFALKNVKCNSGYLMLNYTAALGLPAINGYKLTKVVAKNSSGCSTSTKVGVSSSASSASYISGGAIQTWSKTSSTYTYTLSGTSDNTMYYLYITNKNAQITNLELTYGSATTKTLSSIAISSSDHRSFTVGDTFVGESVTATYSDSSTETVTATYSGYNMSTAGTQTVTASYTEGGVTKTVTYLITVSSGDTPTSSVYNKVTATSDVTDGKYLVVYETGSVAFNGALTTLDATSNTVAVSISNSSISGTASVDAAAFTFTASNGSFLGSGGKYFGNNSDSNALTSSDTAMTNTVTISGGDASIISSGGAYLRYNSDSGQTRFRYYKSSSYTNQKAIQLYKLQEAAVEYSVTATLSHCTSDGGTTCNTGSDYVANITLDSGYDVLSLSNVKSNNVALTSGTDYTWSNNKLTIKKAAIKGDVTFTATGSKSTKTVTFTGDHVTSNGSAAVPYYNSYSATFTAAEGYNLPASITVKKGGTTFTNYSYDQSTGSFSIGSNLIDANITIEVEGQIKSYSLTTSGLINITFTEDTESVHTHGGEFSGTLSTSKGWTLNGATITVKMGGTALPNAYNENTHKVEISSVTGDIVISGSAVEVTGAQIELSAYTAEFNYLANTSITIIATNATVTGFDYECTSSNNVASFALGQDNETITISSTASLSYGTSTYSLTIYYEDDGGFSDSKTFTGFEVKVNRYTTISYSLTNATSDKTSTTSYDYGTEFDITITPNQYYTLEEGDITVLADGDDITDTVTVIDSDEALISLEDEYDSVSITVNATKIPAYVVSIAITTQATTKTFKVGATFDHDGIVITGTNNDGTSAGIVTSMCQFSAPDMLTAGEKTVTITYDNNPSIYTSYTITITETVLLEGGLSTCGWTNSQVLSTVYNNLELSQSNVGIWALSSGEQYNNKGMNYVLGDWNSSNGSWSNFSNLDNFKSLAKAFVDNKIVLKRANGDIYGRYGAILSKDFNISRFYKAEIAWSAFISGGTGNTVHLLGTKDGGINWDVLASEENVTAGASASGNLTWNNTTKYSSTDKVFFAIAYTSTSEVVSNSSPAMRNITWKLYGDALNKNQKWNAFDFSLSKTASSLKVGEDETLTITQQPSFADDTFTWASSDSAKATVDQNGKVTAVAVTGIDETVTITATSSQGVAKSCAYTINPADVDETSVQIMDGGSEAASTVSIQERSDKQFTANVLPADATYKDVTWSITNASPAGCATVDTTGKVSAISAGSATLKVVTDNKGCEASISLTITEYPSYNIVYKSGEGTGDDITVKVDYDKDATAKAADTFTPPTGKSFDYWQDGSGNHIAAGGEIKKLSQGSTLTLTAIYTANSYTITYKDQGDNTYSGTNTLSIISYTYGVGVSQLESGVKSGFTFDGWFVNSACTGTAVTSISDTSTGNKTFYAKWTFSAQSGLESVYKNIGMSYQQYGYDPSATPTEGFVKATSIAAGDKVIFVYENTKYELDGISTTNTKYGIATSYSTSPAGKYELDVVAGSSAGTIAFKNSSNNYLYWGSGNSLTTNASLSANTSWTVEFDSDGNANIVNAFNTSRVLRFNTNKDQQRFACYDNSQAKIQIYKYVEEPAKHYTNVDFRFNFKFKGIATFAQANHVDSDYGLVISYSGRTRYFSVKNKQVLENGKDNVSLNYKETGTDEGYFTIRLGIKGDVMNYLEQSQIKYKVQVYTQDSAGNKYTSDTFVEFSVQSMIEQYYNDPRYCTQAVKDLYAIFGPTAKEE